MLSSFTVPNTRRGMADLVAVMENRPGAAEPLYNRLAHLGVDVLNSQEVGVGSSFVVLATLAVSEVSLPGVTELIGAPPADMVVVLKQTRWVNREDEMTPHPPHETHELNVISDDNRPGIMAVIRKVVADQGANVTSAASRTMNAPESGAVFYVTTMRLDVQGEADQLERRLRRLATANDWELDFTPVHSNDSLPTLRAGETIH